MRVGFDLDKVFIGYPPLVPAGLIDWLYKNHNSLNLSYRIPKSGLEIFIRQTSHLPILRPALQANINYVHKLAQTHHHQLFLVSSRYDFLEKITHNILGRYNLISPFKAIYLNTANEQAHKFKERIIKKEKIDVFIDDDLPLIKYLKEVCPQTKLIHYAPGLSLEEVGQFLS